MDMSSKFISEYMGCFELSQEVIRLHGIAKSYHDECDRFDSIVCTGKSKINNEPIPINPWEMKMVNENALSVKKKLYAENHDIPPSVIRKAIREYQQSA